MDIKISEEEEEFLYQVADEYQKKGIISKILPALWRQTDLCWELLILSYQL